MIFFAPRSEDEHVQKILEQLARSTNPPRRSRYAAKRKQSGHVYAARGETVAIARKQNQVIW